MLKSLYIKYVIGILLISTIFFIYDRRVSSTVRLDEMQQEINALNLDIRSQKFNDSTVCLYGEYERPEYPEEKNATCPNMNGQVYGEDISNIAIFREGCAYNLKSYNYLVSARQHESLCKTAKQGAELEIQNGPFGKMIGFR